MECWKKEGVPLVCMCVGMCVRVREGVGECRFSSFSLISFVLYLLSYLHTPPHHHHLREPIPYWLYKLHGLNITYSCEICGNATYCGPKAFRRHFSVSVLTTSKMLSIHVCLLCVLSIQTEVYAAHSDLNVDLNCVLSDHIAGMAPCPWNALSGDS